MVRNALATTALIAAALFTAACGTSTTGPNGGSKQQALTGVSSSGYPAGNPSDVYSPALGSSTESQHSRDADEEGKEAKPAAR